MRFQEDSVFKLAHVLHCSTNQDYKIEDNMCCLPDSSPGLLLGLVRVIFFTIPRVSDEFKNNIIIDVGFSKCLSVPIHFRVLTSNLYKLLGKCLHSGKLLLGIESVFSNNKLTIKEISPSVEDKLLTRYNEQLKQAELYSSNCAALLESTDEMVYYEKLYMLLYIESDHRRRLLQRYTV